MGDGDLKRTPLYGVHTDLGGRMVPFAGYRMPVQYDGILAEHQRVRTAVGLFDVSHMGEVRIRGPEAVEVTNRLITNDLQRIEDGRAQYTCMCAEDGTIVDDLIVYRLSSTDILICVNASNRAADVAHMRTYAKGDATVEDESDAWAQIAVQGPLATNLLGRVFGAEARDMKPFRVRQFPFGQGRVLLSTTGYTGEAGGEIYVPSGAAADLWAALQEAGQDLGVGPAGLGARDTLRLEMAYCLYGNDIDRTTTPLEAGLGWVTRLKKDEFVGRGALLRQKEAGLTRRLVGIEVFERGIPRQGYPVLHDGSPVGTVTSGTKSPSTGRAVGLAYVPVALREPGTALTVDCRGRMRPATVVKTPFYERPS